MYVWNKESQEDAGDGFGADVWTMKGEGADAVDGRAQAKAQAREEAFSRERAPADKVLLFVRMIERLANEEETVVGALKRMRSSGAEGWTTGLEALTDAADDLLSDGWTEAYSATKSDLQRALWEVLGKQGIPHAYAPLMASIASIDPLAVVSTPNPLGGEVRLTQLRAAIEGMSSCAQRWEYVTASPTSTPPPQVHGPFPVAQMMVWAAQGYFNGDGVSVRPASEGRDPSEGDTASTVKPASTSGAEELEADFADEDEADDEPENQVASAAAWQHATRVPVLAPWVPIA
jgi:hypothetical protein